MQYTQVGTFNIRQFIQPGTILALPGPGESEKAGAGIMASAVAQAYNGGLGRSPQRDPGAEPLVRGQGESFSAFGTY